MCTNLTKWEHTTLGLQGDMHKFHQLRTYHIRIIGRLHLSVVQIFPVNVSEESFLLNFLKVTLGSKSFGLLFLQQLFKVKWRKPSQKEWTVTEKDKQTCEQRKSSACFSVPSPGLIEFYFLRTTNCGMLPKLLGFPQYEEEYKVVKQVSFFFVILFYCKYSYCAQSSSFNFSENFQILSQIVAKRFP